MSMSVKKTDQDGLICGPIGSICLSIHSFAPSYSASDPFNHDWLFDSPCDDA